MGRSRGFTLVEVMIAMGISIVLIGGAMAAHVSNLSFYRSTQGRSSLYQDAILLIEFYRNEVMAAGGGSIRAWQALSMKTTAWFGESCPPAISRIDSQSAPSICPFKSALSPAKSMPRTSKSLGPGREFAACNQMSPTMN